MTHEYCAIAANGAAFKDPRLVELRERMSDSDIDRAIWKLEDELDAEREAGALRAWRSRLAGASR